MKTTQRIAPVRKRKTWIKPALQVEKIEKTGETVGTGDDEFDMS
jgi:hypothetical protein